MSLKSIVSPFRYTVEIRNITCFIHGMLWHEGLCTFGQWNFFCCNVQFTSYRVTGNTTLKRNSLLRLSLDIRGAKNHFHFIAYFMYLLYVRIQWLLPPLWRVFLVVNIALRVHKSRTLYRIMGSDLVRSYIFEISCISCAICECPLNVVALWPDFSAFH